MKPTRKYRGHFLPVSFIGGQSSLQVLYAAQGNYQTWDNHELPQSSIHQRRRSAGGSVGGANGTDMLTGRGVVRNNGAGNLAT